MTPSLPELHAAIIGGTGSGKTFLGKVLATNFVFNGVGTLVLHKPREPWRRPAEASWQTDIPERFDNMFWQARGCACFMELADADVHKYNTAFHKMFSQGRHEGHRCFYISQYGPQVHPIIRANCTALYLFATNKKAAATWAEEFNDDSLMRAVTLPPYQFLHKPNRFTPARLCILKT